MPWQIIGSPHIICQNNETLAKVSTADASSYTGEVSAGLDRGVRVRGMPFLGGRKMGISGTLVPV